MPFIMRYQALKKQSGFVDHSSCTVMDLLPTILDICHVEHSETNYKGRQVAPVAGTSWLPYLADSASEIHSEDHVTGWELFSRRAVRQGVWKGLFIPKPHGPGRWQLFNIMDDPGENDDLAERLPEKMEHMVGLYAEYAKRNGVIEQSMESRGKWNERLNEEA